MEHFYVKFGYRFLRYSADKQTDTQTNNDENRTPATAIGVGNYSCGCCAVRRAGSAAYHCYCYDGFYGRNCTLYDPCFSAPCQNSGHCRNLSDTLYSCRCRPGFHGVNCELYNPCADTPCLHGGMCNSIDGQFVCDCELGYYGRVVLSVNSRTNTSHFVHSLTTISHSINQSINLLKTKGLREHLIAL